MPLVVDHNDGEESGCQQLLALYGMRRDLEWIAAGWRTDGPVAMALRQIDLIRELEELIEALDRRLPRVEQAGETAIARDAAALRERAVARLAELADQDVPSHAHAVRRRS